MINPKVEALPEETNINEIPNKIVAIPNKIIFNSISPLIRYFSVKYRYK